MKWLTKIFTSGIENVVKSVGDAIDKNVTNDEERLKMQAELESIRNKAVEQADATEVRLQEEVTKRHASDMQSDDMWSKRIRPMTLMYLLVVVSVLAVTDGNIVWGEYQFHIKAEYVGLFETLLATAFGFYFGSRGIEKIAKIFVGARKS